MSEFNQMDFDAWAEKYKPIINKVLGGTNTQDDPDCDRFETFDEDLAFVKAQNPACVWTMLDCVGATVLSNGYHLVNRLYYMITEVPCEDDIEVECLVWSADYPYPVMWEGEGDNGGLIYGVEWRVYDKNLPNGEPDTDSHYEILDKAWYGSAKRRDWELGE